VHAEIQALGAEVFFVGPETRDNAMKLMDKQNASIPLLYDLDGSVMRSYGLSFELPTYMQPFLQAMGLPEANPETGWQLPIPATYVLDQQGAVHARHVNPDYTYRMEPLDVIEALKEIAAGG
jgi:peroxiredoxin